MSTGNFPTFLLITKTAKTCKIPIFKQKFLISKFTDVYSYIFANMTFFQNLIPYKYYIIFSYAKRVLKYKLDSSSLAFQKNNLKIHSKVFFTKFRKKYLYRIHPFRADPFGKFRIMCSFHFRKKSKKIFSFQKKWTTSQLYAENPEKMEF